MRPLSSAYLTTTIGLTLSSLAVDLSPTLEVLPLNSTLSNVTIPRYDKDRNRIAYLKAELMEILADGKPIDDRQPIMVDCTNIQLRMVDQTTEENTDKALKKVGGDIKVDMEKARYRLNSGVLTAQEKITARSPKFSITGQGGIFQLDSRRGFLFGPLNCEIYPDQLAHNPNNMITPFTALLASANLMTLNPGYQPTSAEELLKVEQLAKSSQTQVMKTREKTVASSSHYQNSSQTADKMLADFANGVESDSLNLLIQNPPPANPVGQAKPPIQNPDLTIHCAGGCFFDGTENLLVLLRDVVVKERRFTLKAQEEIKVFFLAEEKEKKPNEKTEKNDNNPNLSIGDLESLVATGGVHFSGIDEKGNPVEASAAIAFYNDKTKTLILKDGKPTLWLQKGKAQVHMQSSSKNANITVKLSENAVQATASDTSWTVTTKNLPLKIK